MSKLANRDDLRVALVIDRDLITKYARRYYDRLQSNTKNFIALYNSDDPNDIQFLDIEEIRTEDAESWITDTSIYKVMKLTPVNARLAH